MPFDYSFGLGKTTTLYLKKLCVAQANEVISGGDKYYTKLVNDYNTRKVAGYLDKNSQHFQTKVDSFITKKQNYLEKQVHKSIPPVNPVQRAADFDKYVEGLNPAQKTTQVLKLQNIYRYFAQKAKPEFFLG